MFTFDGDRRACHSLREELSLLGDSVTVTGQGPFRVHVHVDFPADAVAEGQSHGRIHSIDITPQMREAIEAKGQPLYQAVGVGLTGAAAVPEEQPEFRRGGQINLSDNPDTMMLELLSRRK
mgnify:CR=1 FL=1